MNRRGFILSSAATACMAGCATHVDATARLVAPIIRLPYRFDYGRRLIVTVYYEDGAPMDFIVDTASTGTALFKNFADRIATSPVDRPPAKILGLSGAFFAPLFQVGDIKIGDVDLNDLQAPVLSDWPFATRTPQGILGLDFLSNYIFFIRKNPNVLELYDAESLSRLSSNEEWHSVILTATDFGVTERSLYTFEVEFSNNRPIPFLLDTGSNFTALNFAAAEYLKIIPLRARTPKSRNTTDVHGNTVDSFAIPSAYQKIGGVEWPMKAMEITDAPFFSEIGYGDRPFGVFGLDSLLQSEFAVDFQRKRLFLKS